MTSERDDFLRRCAASGLPDDIALEMWEDQVEAKAEQIRARLIQIAEGCSDSEGARQ